MKVGACAEQLKKRLEKISPREDRGLFFNVLLEEVLGFDRFHVHLHEQEPVTEAQERKLEEMCRRLEAGEPLQYVCGHWSFYGMEFTVRKGVLIPRADTEILVAAALRRLGEAPSNVMDLCAGSGCIGLALGANCANVANIIAVEKSPEAFLILQENCARYSHISVECLQQDVLTMDVSRFSKIQMIVSNPPYLTAEEMETYGKGLTFEPRMALDGGADGLLFYKSIAKRFKMCLAPKGWLLFEIGFAQRNDVEEILRQEGYEAVFSEKDWNGLDRVVGGQKS